MTKLTVPAKKQLTQMTALKTQANPATSTKRSRQDDMAHIEGSYLLGPAKELQKEPETHGEALRAFVGPAYEPLCNNLAEVRENIDALDRKIVALLAERGRYVKDAARFKRDSFQVSAPQRQQEVLDKVAALAEKEGAYPEVVRAAYRMLIAGFIAREQVDHRAMVDLER
jgi:isochorismate pyruvate lyase